MSSCSRLLKCFCFWKIRFISTYVSECFAWMYMYVHHVSACHLGRSEDGTRSPRTIITGSYEQPYGWWQLDPGPLCAKQQVFSTVELSLQPPNFFLKVTFFCIINFYLEFLQSKLFFQYPSGESVWPVSPLPPWIIPACSLEHWGLLAPQIHL